MQSYQLRFLKRDGSVAAQQSAYCEDDGAAKTMAMNAHHWGVEQIEVWVDGILILSRPAPRTNMLAYFANDI